MAAPYVPLRIFSCYTMLEGAIDPKAVAKQAKLLDFPAAAVTDRNGLYGAMPFTDACLAEGVQPIIGTLLGVARPGVPEGRAPVIDWLALYAQDDAGYRNLCALVSAAHLDRPVEEDAACRLRGAGGADRRPDRADRRRRGRAGAAACRGPGAGSGRLSRPARGAVPGPALCRTEPPRRPGRAGRRSVADRARLCPRPAAGRDQSGRLCRSELPPRP